MSHESLFQTLLCNPPGIYGLTPYGRTSAVSLTGDPIFRERGFNLFASFGGECNRNTHLETRVPTVRASDRPDTIWFALPANRARIALRLYFFGQLYKLHTRDVLDDEGDFITVECDPEAALWEEAEQLACDFIVNHMKTDYAAIPVNEWDHREVPEYGLGSLGAAHESE